MTTSKHPNQPPFFQKVYQITQTIPYGKVVSYGQIASALGNPRLARQVGWALRALGEDRKVPWWRVVNSEGALSIKGNWIATKNLQKHLLEKEGIKVSQQMRLDMDKYNYTFTSHA